MKDESAAEKMSPVALGKMLGYLQHQLTDLHLEKLLGPEASIDLSDPQGALRQWVFVKIELLESFCMSILQSPFNNVSQFTHQVLLLLCASENLMNHSCFLSHVLNKRQIWICLHNEIFGERAQLENCLYMIGVHFPNCN